MDSTEIFRQRFIEALAVKGIKQSDLVIKTGIGKSAISQYATGKYQPKQQKLYLLAKALDVSEAWLMGHDVPMERTCHERWNEKHNKNDCLTSEASLFDQIQHQYGKDAVMLLQNFLQLNTLGKSKAVESVCDLAEIAKYTEKEKTELKNA